MKINKQPQDPLRQTSVERFAAMHNWTYMIGISDLEVLMMIMQRELLVSGHSALLDLCWQSWKAYRRGFGVVATPELKGYSLKESNSRLRLSFGASQLLPYLLSLSLYSVETFREEAKRFMGGLFGEDVRPADDNMVRGWYGKIDQYMLLARGANKQPETQSAPAPAPVTPAEKDAAVILEEARNEAEKALTEARKAAEEQKLQAQEEAAKLLEEARQTALPTAEQVIREARQVAETTIRKAIADGEILRQNAQVEQAALRAEAQTAAARMLEEARTEAEKLKTRTAYEGYAQDRDTLLAGMGAMRDVLMEANRSMRTIEDTLTRTNTQKAYTQLHELYALVCDLHDSLRSSGDDSRQTRVTLGNLEAFRFMITMYLSEYGIEPIQSVPGTAFNGKLHLPKNGEAFHPATAVVGESLRCGFRWGDVVMEKEAVILKRGG